MQAVQAPLLFTIASVSGPHPRAVHLAALSLPVAVQVHLLPPAVAQVVAQAAQAQAVLHLPPAQVPHPQLQPPLQQQLQLLPR